MNRIAPLFIGDEYILHTQFLKTEAMKKIKKQPSVSSVTPVLRVRYVLWYELHGSYLLYERYSSYCRTNEKIKTSIRMSRKSLMSRKSSQ